MDGTIEFSVHRQVGALVGVLGRQLLVDVYADPGGVSRMHESVLEGVGVREYFVGFQGMGHVFLNAKVVNADIKMQGCTHAYWAEIGCAVAARPYLK